MMKRFYWLLVFWILTLVYARVADAQKAFPGIDSAEKVISKTATAITSGTTITAGSPYKIAVTLGTGAKFAKVTPKPFIVMIESSSFTDQTPIEEFRVSAVSNDTLTLIARSPAVGHNLTPQTWAVGSRISVAITGDYIKSLQDTLNWLITNGPGSGTVTSIAFQSPLTGGTITSSGTVTLPMATASQSGYLSSANWSTFNNKQATISVTSPILLAGANISILQSDATHAGYISSTDWNTFNNKASYPDSTGKTGNVLSVIAGGGYDWSSAGSGTVTSVNVSGGSSGLSFINGPITNTGTITIAAGPLTIGYGGTGAITAQKALLNLIGDTTGKTRYFLGVLRGGGIGLDTVTGGGGGGSGVTSVDMTVPSFLSISGNPITTIGTLALSLSGTALPYSSGGTGQIAWTKGDLLYASATNTLSKLGIGSTGQILTVASGLPSWAANSAGTVTSVAASGPAGIMTWSSAVTTTGMLTATLSSQSANMVFASPDGSAAAPSFRSLVTGDIPSLDVAQITSGSFSVARGGTGRSTLTANDLLIGNGTSAVTMLAVGTSDQVLVGGTSPAYATLTTDATMSGNGAGTSFGIDLTHANTWTGTPTVNKANIQTTYTDGLALTNATASDVSHTVQQSPSLSFLSHVWNTTATATDSIEAWREQVIPVSGATTTSSLTWDNGNTAGGFVNVGSLSDAGALSVKTGGSYQINGTSVLNATTLGSGVVNSSLTSVGTIATGVWNGTTLAVNHGGTGAATLTGILFGNGTSAVTGSHAVDLTSEVTGALPVANGGTGQTTYTNGQLLIGNTTGNTLAKATLTGTANQVTVTNGGGSITLSLPNTVHFTNSATTVDVSATASGTDGRNLTIQAGSTGGGTDQTGGALLLRGGDATGAGFGGVQFFVPYTGSTGTTVRSSSNVAAFDANTGVPRLTLGTNSPSHPGGIILFADGVSRYLTLAVPAGAFAASYVVTLPGATGTVALTAETGGGTNQTSYTTGDMLYASATNTLSKRAIGSTNDILTVAGGVPTWTATPTLSALNVTNGTTLNGPVSLHVNPSTKTTTYTILSTDCVVPCDATSAGFTATLPAGATNGQVVIVSKIDSGINTVTVAPGVAQTIIAATGVLSSGNVSLTTTNPNAHLCYIGSNNWILISRD